MITGSVPLILTADVAPFAIRAERLEVLLMRQTDGWSLPGGPIAGDETLDEAARRHLAEQTGLQEVYLEQLYTFTQPGCDLGSRIATVAYYALVPNSIPVEPWPAIAPFCWAPTHDLPALILNHAEIIALAHRRLASKLAYSTIALQLMPNRFTLTELQAVHETILGEPLDKRNFRKRILALDCIEATGEMARRRGYRPARLFRAKRPGQVDFIK